MEKGQCGTLMMESHFKTIQTAAAEAVLFSVQNQRHMTLHMAFILHIIDVEPVPEWEGGRSACSPCGAAVL